MKLLLVDNYDSFTYNLLQYLAELEGQPPDLVRNDQVSFDQVLAGGYHGIVISPGPGTVTRSEDFGVNRQILLQKEIPVLGVCLGHQGLCHAYGGRIDYAPEPMHGRISQVFHRGADLFQDIPSPFEAVRYHSLIAVDPPPCLEVTATTADGLIMGLRHRTRPLWSVQFHPESICTQHGRRLLENFRRLVRQYHQRQCHERQHHQRPNGRVNGVLRAPAVPAASTSAPEPGDRGCKLRWRKLDCWVDAETAFVGLFGDAEPAFWLDSSLVADGLSRWSFMGAGEGADELVSYDVASGVLSIRRGTSLITRRESIFDYLGRRTAELAIDGGELPFPFPGGHVGYLGYEMKAECGAAGAPWLRSPNPDAMFLLASRLLVFDHQEQCLYLVFLEGPAGDDAEIWFAAMQRRLAGLSSPGPIPLAEDGPPLDVEMRHNPSEYLARISESLAEIREGNSYEVCLTNQMQVAGKVDPLTCYRALRKINAAPYAAYLRFPGVAVVCASPERFLTIDRQRWVESKPIKGTAPRGVSREEDEANKLRLQTNEKDRAENLMIVDLLRNDLGIVCEIGSVHVPKLFDVESFATVHQLVSTIRGRLRPGLSAADCVRAAFPGGSMTGAPKRRTMEIIDRLEEGPRGIYSGAIGYFGLDGAADLNIVIRTIVITDHAITLGVGGAIVALSDPESELEEIYLKANASLRALEQTVQSDRRPLAAFRSACR